MRVMRVFMLGLLCIFWLKANGQDKIDSSAWELVIPVEISEARSQVNTIVNLSRKDFLSMPASFDDPSRLLVKYPGFSNPNDQNNGIIYHGMPSWMSGWTVYGAEILNPNHLSAAGTFTDEISASSGGVNAFSGQVIGKYTYRANPDVHTTNDYFAGVSDIKLRDPYKTQISLNTSLIGLESGLDLKGKHWSFMANARYSTVGLLSLLGADFGGEEIDYQDIMAKLTYQKNKVKLNLYSLYGSSSNFKEPNISTPIIENDYTTRAQNENVLVSGINLEIEEDNSLFETTINYSYQKKRHEWLKEYPMTSSQYNYNQKEESLIALNSSYTFFGPNMDWEINLRSKYLLDDDLQLDRNLNQIGLFNKYYIGQRLFIDAGISGLLHTDGFDEKIDYNYSAGLTWISPDYNYKGVLKFSRNTQFFKTPLKNYYSYNQESYIGKSYNLQASLEDQKRKMSYSIFAHLFREIPQERGIGPDVQSLFNSWDILYDLRPLSSTDPLNKSIARIMGLSISKNIVLHKKLNATINWTFMDAQQKLNQSNSIERKINLPFAIRFQNNLLVNYNDLIWEGINLSLSASLRDGFNTGYTESTEESFSQKTPFYFRADARLNYTFNTKRKKYSSMLSLDIQNITGRKNIVGYYYDVIAGEVLAKKQLGFLPVLSWRVVI